MTTFVKPACPLRAFAPALAGREPHQAKSARAKSTGVDLNPVRAGMVRKPDAWVWSSYRAHLGQAAVPAWLDTPGLHGYLLGGPVKSAADRRRAAHRYARLVASAPEANLWDRALRQQIYLGDERFVERMQALAEPRNSTDHDIPWVQRRKSRTLAQWLASCESREEALYRAHTESALSMSAIARELGLSVSRVKHRFRRPASGIRSRSPAGQTDASCC
jgi:putative transposase